MATYYRQDRHYFQLNEKKCMHVNVGCTLINLLDIEDFFCASEQDFCMRRKELVQIEQDEFFAALDAVLFELEISPLR